MTHTHLFVSNFFSTTHQPHLCNFEFGGKWDVIEQPHYTSGRGIFCNLFGAGSPFLSLKKSKYGKTINGPKPKWVRWPVCWANYGGIKRLLQETERVSFLTLALHYLVYLIAAHVRPSYDQSPPRGPCLRNHGHFGRVQRHHNRTGIRKLDVSSRVQISDKVLPWSIS